MDHPEYDVFLASSKHLDRLDWPRRCRCRLTRRKRLYVAVRDEARASCARCCPEDTHGSFGPLCTWYNGITRNSSEEIGRLVVALFDLDVTAFSILCRMIASNVPKKAPSSAAHLITLLSCYCCDHFDYEAQDYLATALFEACGIPKPDPTYLDVDQRTMTLLSTKDAIVARVETIAFVKTDGSADVWRTKAVVETLCDDKEDVETWEFPEELFEAEGNRVPLVSWKNPTIRSKKRQDPSSR